jgi:2-dehydro-3-deoxyglucarate aldolase/4-hydroxy-2-oxoheptanedioate aldolase
VLEAAGRHGKTCAMLVNSPEQTRQWRDAGALLLAYSNEVEVLHEAYSRAMQALRACAEDAQPRAAHCLSRSSR